MGLDSDAVRIVSFAMRAVLAKSESAGENFDLVLAQQIVYGVGFFGILYSAYIMVLDRYNRFLTSPVPSKLIVLQATHQEDRWLLAALEDYRKPTPHTTCPDRCSFAQYYRFDSVEHRLTTEHHQHWQASEGDRYRDFLGGRRSPRHPNRVCDPCRVRKDLR